MCSDLGRVTLPEEGSSTPIKMRSSVVLPMPFGPTSAKRAPLAMENETPWKRSSAPKDLEREIAVIRDIECYPPRQASAVNFSAGVSSSSAHVAGLDSI